MKYKCICFQDKKYTEFIQKRYNNPLDIFIDSVWYNWRVIGNRHVNR